MVEAVGCQGPSSTLVSPSRLYRSLCFPYSFEWVSVRGAYVSSIPGWFQRCQHRVVTDRFQHCQRPASRAGPPVHCIRGYSDYLIIKVIRGYLNLEVIRLFGLFSYRGCSGYSILEVIRF